MDFGLLVGQWFYDAEGEQKMFSAAHAVEEHWNKGWRPTREEAIELAMEKKMQDKASLQAIRTFPSMTAPVLVGGAPFPPVQVDHVIEAQVEETPEERRRRKSRENMARARAAKKAAKQ